MYVNGDYDPEMDGIFDWIGGAARTIGRGVRTVASVPGRVIRSGGRVIRGRQIPTPRPKPPAPRPAPGGSVRDMVERNIPTPRVKPPVPASRPNIIQRTAKVVEQATPIARAAGGIADWLMRRRQAQQPNVPIYTTVPGTPPQPQPGQTVQQTTPQPSGGGVVTQPPRAGAPQMPAPTIPQSPQAFPQQTPGGPNVINIPGASYASAGAPVETAPAQGMPGWVLPVALVGGAALLMTQGGRRKRRRRR